MTCQRSWLTRHHHIKPTAVLLTIGLYFLAYLPLSWFGEYVYHNQGGADNRRTWCARWCEEPYIGATGRTKLGMTFLGVAFLPLILIDQTFVHPTHYIR